MIVIKEADFMQMSNISKIKTLQLIILGIAKYERKDKNEQYNTNNKTTKL